MDETDPRNQRDDADPGYAQRAMAPPSLRARYRQEMDRKRYKQERDPRWKIGGRITLTLIIWILLFAWSVIGYTRQFRQFEQLRESGKTIRGTVIEKSWHEGYDDIDHYNITYEFTVGKSRYTGIEGVDLSTYDSLKEGDSVTIVYLASNPDISSFRAELEPPIPLFPGLLLLGLLIGLWAWWKVRGLNKTPESASQVTHQKQPGR